MSFVGVIICQKSGLYLLYFVFEGFFYIIQNCCLISDIWVFVFYMSRVYVCACVCACMCICQMLYVVFMSVCVMGSRVMLAMIFYICSMYSLVELGQLVVFVCFLRFYFYSLLLLLN